MAKYPEVDPDFYAWGVKTGMSEAEIEADWKAYCDGLEQFHEETSTIEMGQPGPAVPMTCIGGSE